MATDMACFADHSLGILGLLNPAPLSCFELLFLIAQPTQGYYWHLGLPTALYPSLKRIKSTAWKLTLL